MDTLILAAIVVNLVVVCGLWAQLSRKLGRLEAMVGECFVSAHHHGARSEIRDDEFSLWAYRKGEWQLDRPCSAPGLHVGSPPAREGRFEGEIVRTQGVLAK